MKTSVVGINRHAKQVVVRELDHVADRFSSQSHFMTVFRRFMKTTPAAYREEVLGLRLAEPSGRTTQKP